MPILVRATCIWMFTILGNANSTSGTQIVTERCCAEDQWKAFRSARLWSRKSYSQSPNTRKAWEGTWRQTAWYVSLLRVLLIYLADSLQDQTLGRNWGAQRRPKGASLTLHRVPVTCGLSVFSGWIENRFNFMALRSCTTTWCDHFLLIPVGITKSLKHYWVFWTYICNVVWTFACFIFFHQFFAGCSERIMNVLIYLSLR